MIRIIDLDDSGLTTEQVLESVQSADGAILRRSGQVVARLEPADNDDLEDELWARAPEQIQRGQEARERFRRGESIPHDQVRRELGLDSD